MTATIATHSAELTDLAAILAKGYLRLTGMGQKHADSGDKQLDLWAKESPHRDDPGDHKCQQRPA